MSNLILDGQFDYQNVVNQSDSMVFLGGTDNAVSFYGACANDSVQITGTYADLFVGAGSVTGLTIDDKGTGSTLNLSLASNVAVEDFASDPTATISLTKEGTALLVPDGQGGMLVGSFDGGGKILADIVGDPLVSLHGSSGAWQVTND